MFNADARIRIFFNSLYGTKIPIQLFKTIHQFTLLKIFAFAFKFAAKKLGGAVGRLMDYSICRLLYVVFVCVSLYHTIP